ncbi:MAG: DUF5615 family PIN-like protein [Burkholderiaceae bacterium]
MRIPLDESVPARLAPLLVGHESMSVQKRGWSGIQNGRLLAMASHEFEVLLTADRGTEHQQKGADLPSAVPIVVAKSNRQADIAPLVAQILDVLASLAPRTQRKAAG